MTYDPKKHNRRSIRLEGYDYASPGLYFLTLCLQNRACLFGNVENGKMILNTAGLLTDEWWNKIPEKFPNVRLDVYQIMPNHFHAIVEIIDSDKTVGAGPRLCPDKNDRHNQDGHAGPSQPASPQRDFEPRQASIPKIVQWFKTMTTNKYIKGVKNGQYPPFDRKLWQRNYHDHIIRDEESLERIRYYITHYPTQWQKDNNNPQNINF
ncbi:transposase [Fodinibius salsisoli]|uniref:Transposase n=1 Tax=Fodinibius salsisoli TaxID=2820877 RepID=A0ABT3PQ28_9BACT|nr:transposase [Fodinibius salsisoli]MCW9707960.1 transposase [Fodinibius salsisoli]